MRRIVTAGVAAAIFVLLHAHAAKAASCTQMNDRVFGVDGRGGVAARFRDLRVKIDEETRNGQTQAAAGDRAELARLAASILANAKVMQTVHCTAHIVPQTGAVAQRNPPTRSAHGCVGFDGTWQGPGGTMYLRNGSGPYVNTTLQGTVSGNVLRGSWRHPTVGQGTFAFTLAPDGDSFTTVWTSSNGVSGSYNTVRCIGP